MKVGITGADGLIGWHFCCHLLTLPDISIVTANRTTFSSPELLDRFVAQCDVIFHLAGANRGADADVEATNIQLAEVLVASLQRCDRQPHVLFSSSIHQDRDNAYGRSKRIASQLLQNWADKVGANYTCLILPHVFGEHGRPNYNSVVSTFCYQLANGHQPIIDRDGDLELLHTSDVVGAGLEAMWSASGGDLRPAGRRITVSEMLTELSLLDDHYRRGIIPEFTDQFSLNLFNVYRSYLYPQFYPQSLVKHQDDRGGLFEAVKTDHGGQAFLSTTVPGITRGDHFHFHKVERFLVVSGQAEIRLRKLFSDSVETFTVSGDQPVFIDMPTLHTHNITNTGTTELLTFFWSHEIFDPENPDTWSEPVMRKNESS